MTLVAITILVLLALYIGKRWRTASAENATLRAQIVALKRKLERWGR
jgi:hypothetical protein